MYAYSVSMIEQTCRICVCVVLTILVKSVLLRTSCLPSDHGAQFARSERGQCRCIKSEVVCAKASGRMDPVQGSMGSTQTHSEAHRHTLRHTDTL